MEKTQTIKDALRKGSPTVDIDDTLQSALKIMAGENLSALLVKKNGDLVGIITISDIMYSLAKEEDPRQIKVASFMTKCELITTKGARTPCVQLDEDEDILSAIKVMNEAGVNHVLVSGSRGEPEGMLSSLDIIKLLV
jgi:predicted transcriptional regulator